MHASSIATKYGAVLFVGMSGVGKSTTLGAFLQRGYTMLADDITGIILNEQQIPVAIPAFPRNKLREDAATSLGHDISKLPTTRSGLKKYELYVPSQLAPDGLPLFRIYQLGTSNTNEFEITAVQPFEYFGSIVKNTYRQHFLDGLEMRVPHFDMISCVARHAEMRRVVRPRGIPTLDRVVSLIEADLAN